MVKGGEQYFDIGQGLQTIMGPMTSTTIAQVNLYFVKAVSAIIRKGFSKDKDKDG